MVFAAQNPGQYITLTFHSLQTECAYDHVFIYDGSSVHSPMKGSFSGRGLPSPVTAKSFFTVQKYILTPPGS